MTFTNKRVLVTGSSRGIGLATAQRFLAEGAAIVINGRSQDTVNAALASLNGRDKISGVVADIARVSAGACLSIDGGTTSGSYVEF